MNTLTTDKLTAVTADSLAWLSELGFKYFKSFGHFRRKEGEVFSYIAINSVTHSRAAYHLAFYLGVQIPQVEEWILTTMGNPRKLTHYDRTIWNYTVNIGPGSSNWVYPIRGTWTFETLSDFDSSSGEIASFVRNLAVPFITENQTAEQIRQTLIATPRHATNIWPYRQILAIDCLYSSDDQLEQDIQLLDKQYEKYAAQPRKDFEDFVALVRKRKEVEQNVPANPLQH